MISSIQLTLRVAFKWWRRAWLCKRTYYIIFVKIENRTVPHVSLPASQPAWQADGRIVTNGLTFLELSHSSSSLTETYTGILYFPFIEKQLHTNTIHHSLENSWYLWRIFRKCWFLSGWVHTNLLMLDSDVWQWWQPEAYVHWRHFKRGDRRQGFQAVQELLLREEKYIFCVNTVPSCLPSTEQLMFPLAREALLKSCTFHFWTFTNDLEKINEVVVMIFLGNRMNNVLR